MSYWVPMEPEPTPPPEERFYELFKAARALLSQDAEEDQIIPTLAFANELGQDLSHLCAQKRSFARIEDDSEAWQIEADKFVHRYGSLRPVRMVDGVLFLERLPVSVIVEDDDDTPSKEIVITVYSHRRLAKPEHVGFLYEKSLSGAHLDHDEQRTGHMSFDFHSRSLVITIRSGTVWERSRHRDSMAFTFHPRQLHFPHPRLVQEFYRMLLGSPSGDGFARHLATRTRGGAPTVKNLVPACVAFYLREYGEIGSRKEIHRLLNEHVLYETDWSLPDEAFGSSETNQLWRDVSNHRKIRNPLMDAGYTLFWEGEE